MITRQLEHFDHHQHEHGLHIFILADGVELSANIGSLFRLADAMGVKKLFFMSKDQAILDKKAKKAARSSQKYINYAVVKDIDEVLLELDSPLILSLELTDSSLDINSLNLPLEQAILLVIGAENQGISDLILSKSHYVVHIPMYGKNSSMNVIHSAAIMLYECIRQSL